MLSVKTGPKTNPESSAERKPFRIADYFSGLLSYGSIISVYTGPDETNTALTDDGIDELKDMFRDPRRTTETWHAFLDDFLDDAELVARIKAQSPR